MCAKSALKSKPSSGRDGGEKIITVNRRAYHDYFIEEEVEAGIQLTGTEIKSIRDGRMNLRDAFARVERGEMWLYGMHISPYGQAGTYFNHDPLRPRKLLLHRAQIAYMAEKSEAKGYSLIRFVWRYAKGERRSISGSRKASGTTTSASRLPSATRRSKSSRPCVNATKGVYSEVRTYGDVWFRQGRRCEDCKPRFASRPRKSGGGKRNGKPQLAYAA